MGTVYSSFDTTPTNLVADLKTKILLSSDWANITGNIVKATTTRGAQMVVDLADATANAARAQFGVYRTHDGTTGVDKVVRYINWRGSGGATSDPIHVRVSSGKEHLYIDIEGPRAGEANPQDGAYGSVRNCFFTGDIVPYFSGDSIATVAMFGATTTGSGTSSGSVTWHVSRNQGNTLSWVPANAMSLQVPIARDNLGSIPTVVNSVQPLAAGDGKLYMWPYVLVEQTDGIRGRINKAFFCGMSVQNNGEATPAIYSRRTFAGDTYILLNPARNASFTDAATTGFGLSGSNTTPAAVTQSPIVAIPYG